MKKFTIATSLLRPALKKLSQATGNKTLPVLKNLHCSISETSAEFTTSDTELTITYRCEVIAESAPFELLVPFDFLNKVVALTKGESIEVAHPSTRKAKISSGEDVYELNSLEKLEDFPALPALPKKNVMVVPGSVVHTLSRAMHTTRNEEDMNPAIAKALLDIQEKYIDVVSTDLQSLFKYRVAAEAKEPAKLLISSKTAKVLDGTTDIELSWSSKMMAFKTDRFTVWSRQFEEKFPDYKTIIPSYPSNLNIKRDELADAMRKACLSSLVTKETVIHLKQAEGRIHFETEDPDYGRKIQTSVAALYTGDGDKITINAGKMLTVVDQIESENISLHIAAATKAVIITCEDDNNYLGLIIPIKKSV